MERITSWTQALVVHAPSGHSEGNSAFETGGVQASDEPEHGVGPQHVAHEDRLREMVAGRWSSGCPRGSLVRQLELWLLQEMVALVESDGGVG